MTDEPEYELWDLTSGNLIAYDTREEIRAYVRAILADAGDEVADELSADNDVPETQALTGAALVAWAREPN